MGQTDKRELDVDFSSDDSNTVDMTGWTVVAAIVGRAHAGSSEGQGNPTGTAGGPPLATALVAFTLQPDNKTFVGEIDCDTDEMEFLIGSKASATSKLEIRATNADGTSRFLIQNPCVILAAVIETGASVVSSAIEFTVTVLAGQMTGTAVVAGVGAAQKIMFTKAAGVGGPLPDRYDIGVNEEDATQSTVTVTMAAAPGADVTFTGVLL